MTSNPYLRSASGFLRESASRIRHEMASDSVIQSTLNFAIGMERVLKGTLYDVNPTYVLVSPEFSHSLKVIYPNKILASQDGESVLAKTPTADVITFRNSLLRAAEISRATQKNKTRLFGLSNLRDLIVHHDLALLDLGKAQTLLQRDFYLILLDFAEELRITRTDWFGDSETTLIQVSRENAQDIKKIIRLKIEQHRRVWDSVKQAIDEVQKKNGVTDEFLESAHRYETACPACNQRAVLFSQPDYVIDVDNAGKHVVGEFVRLIHCEFCGLHIDDDVEIDELGYGKNLHPETDDGIPF